MAFQEKSAWIMAFALFAGALWYFTVVATEAAAGGALPAPGLGPVIVLTILLVVVAVAGHVVIAALSPRDASARSDERERRIFERASHWSGYVLGATVVTSLAGYLITGSGDLLFYTVFGSLIVSQLAEYVLQIVFYRVGV